MIRGVWKTLNHIWRHPLARRNRRAALGRWLRWQVGTRMLNNAPVVVPFVEDAVLIVERGMTGATGCVYCGLHEFEDMALLLHYLRPGELFVDIGANVGTYSVLAAKAALGRCMSFEPVPTTYTKLIRNLAVNRLDRLAQHFCCAVGSSEGRLRFSADMDTMNGEVQADYPGRAIDVPVRALDAMLPGESGTIWKIDVEGHEKGVLEGATQCLARPQLNVLIVEGHSPDVRRILEGAGFKACLYDPDRRRLHPAGKPVVQRLNTAWIRDLTLAERRCREARRYRIIGTSV